MPKPNLFDKANAVIEGTEGSVVNLLTAIAPWGAPLIPAYMTYQHAVQVLAFPEWIALITAAVVEILGLGTISTGIKFWKFNMRKVAKSEYKKAPVGLVVVAFLFYLTAVISSNVLLDYFTGTPFQKNMLIVVRAIFTLQTIPAGLIIAVRHQHHEALNPVQFEQKPNEGVQNPVQVEQKLKPSERAWMFIEQYVNKNVQLPAIRDISEHAPCSIGTASNVLNEYIKQNFQMRPDVITRERYEQSIKAVQRKDEEK